MTMNEEKKLVESVRDAGNFYGCRIDICSYDEKRPVTASDAIGSCYGFGLTPEEAVADLNARMKKKAKT